MKKLSTILVAAVFALAATARSLRAAEARRRGDEVRLRAEEAGRRHAGSVDKMSDADKKAAVEKAAKMAPATAAAAPAKKEKKGGC